MVFGLESARQDPKYRFRVLRRRSKFAIAAILTLAIAIGAQPLPFPHREQLVFFGASSSQHQRALISPADLHDRSFAKSFRALSSLMGQSVNLTGVDSPARFVGLFVSPEYFRIPGVRAQLGRTVRDDDRAVTISYGLWQERLGGDPAMVSRGNTLNGEPFTVAGSMATHSMTRLPASQLFGVGAIDLPVYVVFGLVMLAVSAIAVLVPARRATQLVPMRALRSE